jgi:hypothetical protein
METESRAAVKNATPYGNKDRWCNTSLNWERESCKGRGDGIRYIGDDNRTEEVTSIIVNDFRGVIWSVEREVQSAP